MESKDHDIRTKKILVLVLGLCLVLAVSTPVSAHETITVGAYSVEYDWLNKPAVSGQPNAIVINFYLASPEEDAKIDVSSIIITFIFGDQSKVFKLQPLQEDTPGQYIIPITPMQPGKYVVHLNGNISTTSFNINLRPEEVHRTDTVQFPIEVASSSTGSFDWMALAGIGLGLLGTAMGALALMRMPTEKKLAQE